MDRHQEKKFTESWFFKWVLNSQATVAVMVTFLVFLTLYLFTKISFLFKPILSFSHHHASFGDFGNSLLSD